LYLITSRTNVFNSAVPVRDWFPDVIVIDDDDDEPIPPGVEPAESDVSLNIMHNAARFGRFPTVAAPSASSPPAPDAGSRPSSADSSVFAECEVLHGDAFSSDASESSGSELSGDFVVHDEPVLRRQDRKIMELYFPLTSKRLRMTRVAPHLVASRPYRKHRDSHGFLD
jgi:hypothetical protein